MFDSRTLSHISLSPALILLIFRVGVEKEEYCTFWGHWELCIYFFPQTIVSYGVVGREGCLVGKRLSLVGSPVCRKLCFFSEQSFLCLLPVLGLTSLTCL